jgi:hypothetical protein
LERVGEELAAQKALSVCNCAAATASSAGARGAAHELITVSLQSGAAGRLQGMVRHAANIGPQYLFRRLERCSSAYVDGVYVVERDERDAIQRVMLEDAARIAFAVVAGALAQKITLAESALRGDNRAAATATSADGDAADDAWALHAAVGDDDDVAAAQHERREAAFVAVCAAAHDIASLEHDARASLQREAVAAEAGAARCVLTAHIVRDGSAILVAFWSTGRETDRESALQAARAAADGIRRLELDARASLEREAVAADSDATRCVFAAHALRELSAAVVAFWSAARETERDSMFQASCAAAHGIGSLEHDARASVQREAVAGEADAVRYVFSAHSLHELSSVVASFWPSAFAAVLATETQARAAVTHDYSQRLVSASESPARARVTNAEQEGAVALVFEGRLSCGDAMAEQWRREHSAFLEVEKSMRRVLAAHEAPPPPLTFYEASATFGERRRAAAAAAQRSRDWSLTRHAVLDSKLNRSQELAAVVPVATGWQPQDERLRRAQERSWQSSGSTGAQAQLARDLSAARLHAYVARRMPRHSVLPPMGADNAASNRKR